MEQIQKNARKIIRGAENLSYKERLMLQLFSLEKWRLQRDCIVAFQNLKGDYKKDGESHFNRAQCNKTRGDGFQLKEGRFRLDLRKKFFRMRLVIHWPRLPREVVDLPSLVTFQVRLDRALTNLI